MLFRKIHHQNIYIDKEIRRYTEKDEDPHFTLVQRQLLQRLFEIFGIFVISLMFVAFTGPFLHGNDYSEHVNMLLFCQRQQHVGQFPGHCSLCWRERNPRLGSKNWNEESLWANPGMTYTPQSQWILFCFNKILVNRKKKKGEDSIISSEWRGLARIICFNLGTNSSIVHCQKTGDEKF